MSTSVKLRALGFCGIDDSVTPEILEAISARYKFVEWGILFRDEKQGTARFASIEWLKKLNQLNVGRHMKLAGHLCSTRCEQALNGDASFIVELHKDVSSITECCHQLLT
jgi:hypothetical protein